jgi:hypothetical protein
MYWKSSPLNVLLLLSNQKFDYFVLKIDATGSQRRTFLFFFFVTCTKMEGYRPNMAIDEEEPVRPTTLDRLMDRMAEQQLRLREHDVTVQDVSDRLKFVETSLRKDSDAIRNLQVGIDHDF